MKALIPACMIGLAIIAGPAVADPPEPAPDSNHTETVATPSSAERDRDTAHPSTATNASASSVAPSTQNGFTRIKPVGEGCRGPAFGVGFDRR